MEADGGARCCPARNRDHAHDFIVGPQWHQNRAALPNIGECVDRVTQRLGDQRLARAENQAAAGGVHRNPLAHNLGGIQPYRRSDNQRVDFVNR